MPELLKRLAIEENKVILIHLCEHDCCDEFIELRRSNGIGEVSFCN